MDEELESVKLELSEDGRYQCRTPKLDAHVDSSLVRSETKDRCRAGVVPTRSRVSS